MTRFDCSAVLFDLDGVLVDSFTVIKRHWRRWAESRGVDLMSVLANSHGRPSAETIAIVAPQLDAQREAEALEAVQARDTDGLLVVEGARELVATLPAEGWAVVTSGTRVMAEARLRHTGIPIPDVLVTADDVRHGKPDPEPFLTAAERMGLAAPECVVVEDAPAGIAAAKAADMVAIGFAFHGPRVDLAAADAVVTSLAEIGVGRSDRGGLEITVGAGVA